MAILHPRLQSNLLRNKTRRLFRKGLALAGLFFALPFLFSLASLRAAQLEKLPADSQENFRKFIEEFTPLVLKYEKAGRNPRWGNKNKDCAGLVRYLFWEALQDHNESFYTIYPEMYAIPKALADKKAQQLRQGWMKSATTASGLVRHTTYLGKERTQLQLKTGDILFFESRRLKIRHVMLVVRVQEELYLVYHTGDTRNELRIRTFADLGALLETHWHATPTNPVFQGFFRPSFLD
ncbi:MAG: hypothetical protein LDLANPLL_01981 [Turneriella sp.]|nr:hypothetical protein [Turneriella sp.]